jgi:hypothetical protein
MDRRVTRRKGRRAYRAEELTSPRDRPALFAADPVETVAPARHFQADASLSGAKARPNYASCCPELRPIATQVFAEIWDATCPAITGDADVNSNREIRVSNLRRPARERTSHHDLAQRGTCSRRVPVCTEKGPNAPRRPLVLPHRPCHQTPLLVSRGGRPKVCAKHPAEFAAVREAGFAESRNRDARFDRGRSR